MYSHDTFGLGHLRRCRTIAHSLVENYRGLNVLIISGATIAGAFDYRARVDFVKIPSVIKLRNGEYTSMDRHIDLQETMKMRQSIIRHTAETFEPDIFIIDKNRSVCAARWRRRSPTSDPRHDAGARAARRDGRPSPSRSRMAAA